MTLTAGNASGDAGRASEGIDPSGLLDLVSDLVLVSSPNGLVRYANQAWRDTLGYSDQDIQRLLMLDVVHPDYEQHYSEVIRHVTRGQSAREFTSMLVTRSGEPLPVAGRMDWQPAANDSFLLRSIMRDLRAEHAAEAAIHDITAQFESAFESPAIGMAVQGLDGSWLAVNEALSEILGYSHDELLKMSDHDITHPDDIDQNVKELQQLLTGAARRFQMDKRYVHRDGAVVSVILTISVVTDSDGTPLRFVSQIQDITARAKLETQLLHRASHDPLTGLPNRALFLDRLEHALSHQQRDHGQVTVMFLDLDGFKAVNDQFGHEQGDRLLVEIGRRLRACARAGDTVARLGGDEFTILLENVRHPSIATEVAQRVRETLRYPIMLGEHVTSVTPSIGIALSLDADDRAETML
ncbi:MAG TPA: diguanylate cyclase, partial [Thermomicrobiales bacterium]|nr:diguanylate cyclase [Thermomicrobiales bacterium]